MSIKNIHRMVLEKTSTFLVSDDYVIYDQIKAKQFKSVIEKVEAFFEDEDHCGSLCLDSESILNMCKISKTAFLLDNIKSSDFVLNGYSAIHSLLNIAEQIQMIIFCQNIK